jgi:hypothetical protein
MISEKVHYFIKWKDYDISKHLRTQENLKNCAKHFDILRRD